MTIAWLILPIIVAGMALAAATDRLAERRGALGIARGVAGLGSVVMGGLWLVVVL